MAHGPQRLSAFARELAADKKPLDAALAAGCLTATAPRLLNTTDFMKAAEEALLGVRQALTEPPQDSAEALVPPTLK
jgi:hypothetical protein